MACPPTKTRATRASQPNTAVLRCRTLHPAIRSTNGARRRGRRPGLCWFWLCWSWLGGPACGNTGFCGWLILASHSGVPGAAGRFLALARELPLTGGGSLLAAVGRMGGRGRPAVLQRAQRARSGQDLLGRRERIGGGAEQGARDRRVRAGGGDQGVVEDQEQDQEAGRGEQGRRQAVHVKA